ncbi:hypothetical protein ACP4OV_024040 [Aristida adscensionis]
MGGEKAWREREPTRRRSSATEAEAESESEWEELGDADLADPIPDLQELFRHYDALYFRGALAAAGFAVQWSSAVSNRRVLNTSSFGSCTFLKPSNTITLSESMLRHDSPADLKNALLHEMIHAILYLKHQMKSCCTHGPKFRAWMDAINSCSIEDHQRPHNGYTITTRHDFGPEEPHSIRGFQWECKSCGDTLVRATNQGRPSDDLCIENVKEETCGNMLCRWHNHKETCDGSYEKISSTRKEDPIGTQLLLTYPSDISETQGAIQESNADGRFLSLVSTSNANSLGSNSKGGGKRRRLEDVLKASPPLTSPLRKLKLSKSSAASEVLEFLSPVGSNDAKLLGARISKMEGKQCEPEDVQKSSVPPAATQRKLKRDLVASENCNNAKSLRRSSSKKAAEQHKPESAQKARPPRKSKQDRVTLEKNELFSQVVHNDTKSPVSSSSMMAGKQYKPKDAQKLSVLPASTQRKVNQEHALVASEKNEPLPLLYPSKAKSARNLSKKAAKQHNPEISQQAYSQRTPKQDLVATEKNKLFSPRGRSNTETLGGSGTSEKKAHRQHEPENFAALRKQKSKCKRKPAMEKEYAVMSTWLNCYESECSSGSTEPLVNKRTVRRKIERERHQFAVYSRSRKQINCAPRDFSMVNASVSCKEITTEPHKDETSQQPQPLPPSLDIVVTTTDAQMVTQTTGDQSQLSAPCLDIVAAEPADQVAPLQWDFPAGPVASSCENMICISDDD